ncbi:hypothetical protein J3D43_000951 [Paenibacillus xylanexedens]|nr:hypothetical protein [Paenibacillus xylanexedens]
MILLWFIMVTFTYKKTPLILILMAYVKNTYIGINDGYYRGFRAIYGGLKAILTCVFRSIIMLGNAFALFDLLLLRSR